MRHALYKRSNCLISDKKTQPNGRVFIVMNSPVNINEQGLPHAKAAEYFRCRRLPAAAFQYSPSSSKKKSSPVG